MLYRWHIITRKYNINIAGSNIVLYEGYHFTQNLFPFFIISLFIIKNFVFIDAAKFVIESQLYQNVMHPGSVIMVNYIHVNLFSDYLRPLFLSAKIFTWKMSLWKRLYCVVWNLNIFLSLNLKIDCLLMGIISHHYKWEIFVCSLELTRGKIYFFFYSIQFVLIDNKTASLSYLHTYREWLIFLLLF